MLARSIKPVANAAAATAAAKRSVHATRAAPFLLRGLEDVRAAGRELSSADGALTSRYVNRGDNRILMLNPSGDRTDLG